jgi:hypothetical protein
LWNEGLRRSGVMRGLAALLDAQSVH